VERKRRQYSNQFKFQVSLEAVKGLQTINQIAAEYNLRPNQVRTWKKQLLAKGPVVFESSETPASQEFANRETELREQIERLTIELERLKEREGWPSPLLPQSLPAETESAAIQHEEDQKVLSNEQSQNGNLGVQPDLAEPSEVVVDDHATDPTGEILALEAEDKAGTYTDTLDQVAQQPEQFSTSVTEMTATAPVVGQPLKRPVTRRKLDKFAQILLAIGLFFLAAAIFTFFVNPFTRLGLRTATIAPLAESPELPEPASITGDWCLRGDFYGDGSPPTLLDDGTQGDIIADDHVYSLEYTIPRAGSYQWQVVNCADATVVYPTDTAWIQTSEDMQSVTFVFDVNEQPDLLFPPVPYVINASDSTEEYRVVGDFQGWNINDPSFLMKPVDSRLYQQTQQIAFPGTYQGYLVERNSWKAIDAYGRTYAPIPFVFSTQHRDEYVVFLLDTDLGRASVLHEISPFAVGLAFGQIHRYASLALATVSGIFLTIFLVRQRVLHNRKLWLESGCPKCGQHDLMRTHRRRRDRILHKLRIPVYRYECRSCTWRGVRLR
jgi:transposase-like protein